MTNTCPNLIVIAVIGGILNLLGCQPAALTFQPEPLTRAADKVAYDTNGDGKLDFWMLANSAGRYDRIGYDRHGSGKMEDVVNLDALSAKDCRHLVIVLDGFPFDVVKEFYDAGHLRLLHPPTPLVAPYPVLTDMSLQDVFHCPPCNGFEDLHYSRDDNKVVGGVSSYLAGRQEPWAKIIAYRIDRIYDGPAYLWPESITTKEMNDIKRVWDRRDRTEVVAYSMASAGMGSRLGKPGHIATLKMVERMINQIAFESRGLAKFTLLADHGQTNVPCTDAKLDEFLKSKGWKVAEQLKGDKDVVLIKFGLETYASLCTRRPAALVNDLLTSPKVELASYVRDGAVVVRTSDGEATVRTTDGQTFEYEKIKGDPLKLGETVKVDGREQLVSSVAARAYYPDALARIWRAHFGLAKNPPDVIVSLDDKFYNGSSGFAGAVSMASTHGGLNWRNSVTIIMSSAAPIPGPVRCQDVPKAIEAIFHHPFPAQPELNEVKSKPTEKTATTTSTKTNGESKAK